jgi:hypothetical protein
MAQEIISVDPTQIDVTITSEWHFATGTPLYWAFIARQPRILDLFLTTTGSLGGLTEAAHVTGSDYWTHWLGCTITRAEWDDGDLVPQSFIDTAKALLDHGWPINKAGISKSVRNSSQRILRQFVSALSCGETRSYLALLSCLLPCELRASLTLSLSYRTGRFYITLSFSPSTIHVVLLRPTFSNAAPTHSSKPGMVATHTRLRSKLLTMC